MVAQQIVPRGVRDPRVLAAMRRVPRHAFVPAALEAEAYLDKPARIGDGQTISQPFMVAAMTQELRLESHHRVLEIGTGSGYQTAVLAALAQWVYSIERIESLAARAQAVLAGQGVSNCTLCTGDGSEGWPEHAPFDRILVTAAAPMLPSGLEAQLAPGGRLLAPIGPRDRQVLTAVDRTADGWVRTQGIGCLFVPLVGKGGWPS